MKRDFILSMCLVASLSNLIISLARLKGNDALQVLTTKESFGVPVPVVHHVPASTTGANIDRDTIREHLSISAEKRSNAAEEALVTVGSGLRGSNAAAGLERTEEKVQGKIKTIDGQEIKQATIRSVKNEVESRKKAQVTPKKEQAYDIVNADGATEKTASSNPMLSSEHSAQNANKTSKKDTEHDYPRVVFLSSQGTISCEYTKCSSESNKPSSTTNKFENEMGEYKGPPSDTASPPMPTYEDTCIQGRAWHSLNHINCNSFHEIDMGLSSKLNDNINKVKCLAHGGRRSAWELKSNYEKVILKMLRPGYVEGSSKTHAEFDEEFLDNQRMDALAHERLTHSSHVINVYGFCGASTFNEYAGGGNFRDWLSKGENKNTATDKLLVIARNISMALAEAHGIDAAYPDDNDNSAMPKGMPSLLHQDFRHHNVLMTDNGRIKISDFNAGRLLRWDTAKQRTCGYKWDNPCKVLHRQAKAPEECADEKTLEQLSMTSSQDVWQLGTVLRYILDRKRSPFAITKSNEQGQTTYVFYDDKTETPYNKTVAAERMRKMTREGFVPRLLEGYLNSTDPAIRAIVKARDMSFRINPEERASAREIATILDMAIEEISSLRSLGASNNGGGDNE